MALWKYKFSIPSKILNAGRIMIPIEVEARSLKQAKIRALKYAISKNLICTEKDWRWQNLRTEYINASREKA